MRSPSRPPVWLTLHPTAAYASSKAALNSISETLRLELSPFGVSVVTILAGVFDSEFHANDSDFDLPINSRYAPIKDTIASWASGEAKPKGCPSHEFAEALVDDVIGSKASTVYKGPHAEAVKFMATWLPTSLGVSRFLDASMRDSCSEFLQANTLNTNSNEGYWQDLFMSYGQGLKELSQKVSSGSDKGNQGRL